MNRAIQLTVQDSIGCEDALWLSFRRGDDRDTVADVRSQLMKLEQKIDSTATECAHNGNPPCGAESIAVTKSYIAVLAPKIYICEERFSEVGPSQRAKTFVHEMCHATLDMDDVGNYPYLDLDSCTDTVSRSPEERWKNADSWACYVHNIAQGERASADKRRAVEGKTAHIVLVDGKSQWYDSNEFSFTDDLGWWVSSGEARVRMVDAQYWWRFVADDGSKWILHGSGHPFNPDAEDFFPDNQDWNYVRFKLKDFERLELNDRIKGGKLLMDMKLYGKRMNFEHPVRFVRRMPPPSPVHVTVSAGTLFEFGSDTLRPAAEAALLAALGSSPTRADLTQPFLVEGHTDAKGSEEFNLTLSQRRADRIASVLEGRFPNVEGHLTVAGLGESRPIAPNVLPDGRDDPVGRSLNRRVEVRFSEH